MISDNDTPFKRLTTIDAGIEFYNRVQEFTLEQPVEAIWQVSIPAEIGIKFEHSVYTYGEYERGTITIFIPIEKFFSEESGKEWTTNEIARQKAVAKAEEDARKAVKAARDAVKQEEHERAQLAKLKAKYEV